MSERNISTDEWSDAPDKKIPVVESDHWGQEVMNVESVAPRGAGEKRECRRCGSSGHHIAMYAITDDSEKETDCWEEFYICRCGARGRFRGGTIDGRQLNEWRGQIGYPER